jgi:hypothetical protein
MKEKYLRKRWRPFQSMTTIKTRTRKKKREEEEEDRKVLLQLLRRVLKVP